MVAKIQSLVQLLMGEIRKERVEKCCIVLSEKCYDGNVNGCKTLNFGTVTNRGGCKRKC